jgi:hypothetical protein
MAGDCGVGGGKPARGRWGEGGSVDWMHMGSRASVPAAFLREDDGIRGDSAGIVCFSLPSLPREHTEASIQGFSPGTIGTQGKPRASAPPSEENGKATHKVPRRASRRRRHPASQHPLAPPRSPAFLRRENLTDRSSQKIQSLVPSRPSESATPGSLYPFPSEAGRAVIPPVRIRPPTPARCSTC